MIDIHAHFAEEGYEFPAEWEKIEAAGVELVVLAADTLAHAAWHRAFAKTHRGCKFTAGVHPEFAGKFAFGKATLAEFSDLCTDPDCVAVGEIGLDYHYPGYDARAQRDLFERQLSLAEEFGLPVQIHSRDACADTLAILKEHAQSLSRGFLMHCYSYGAENLDEFLALGGYFSFGGVACFSNAKRVARAVAACPKERLLSETDSPYLSPFRGERNSPANIPVIVARIAELKGMTVAETERQIRSNAVRLFPKIG